MKPTSNALTIPLVIHLESFATIYCIQGNLYRKPSLEETSSIEIMFRVDSEFSVAARMFILVFPGNLLKVD
jgi:hypothetical protein